MIHVKAPNVMKGYLLNSPELISVNDIPSGNCYKTSLNNINDKDNFVWFKTGDIVDIDKDGFIFIKGRLKRFAKIAGEMVSLETTERIAKTVQPDHEHAVVSIPEERKGESLILFTTDQELTREQLVTVCRTLGCSELSIPKQIKVLDKIPMLGTGKVDYVSLKNLLSYC